MQVNVSELASGLLRTLPKSGGKRRAQVTGRVQTSPIMALGCPLEQGQLHLATASAIDPVYDVRRSRAYAARSRTRASCPYPIAPNTLYLTATNHTRAVGGPRSIRSGIGRWQMPEVNPATNLQYNPAHPCSHAPSFAHQQSL